MARCSAASVSKSPAPDTHSTPPQLPAHLLLPLSINCCPWSEKSSQDSPFPLDPPPPANSPARSKSSRPTSLLPLPAPVVRPAAPAPPPVRCRTQASAPWLHAPARDILPICSD